VGHIAGQGDRGVADDEVGGIYRDRPSAVLDLRFRWHRGVLCGPRRQVLDADEYDAGGIPGFFEPSSLCNAVSGQHPRSVQRHAVQYTAVVPRQQPSGAWPDSGLRPLVRT
jgi:hypothetical protein